MKGRSIPRLVFWLGMAGAQQALADEVVELGAITVEAKAERADGPVVGYRATRSATATKTDTALADVPQSVSVVPAAVLEDLQSPRVERALDFAGGVSRQNDFGGLTLYEYSVRGLTTSEFYRDGFSANRGYMASPDAAGIERIEVLKGPASSAYGRGDPGGVVNLVSKQPVTDRFARGSVSAGSWDQYRGALDINAPVGDGDAVHYRLNLAVEDNGSFRDHIQSQRHVIAPSLYWDISARTRLLLQAEILRSEQIFDRGIVAPGGRLGRASRRDFFGEPGDGAISNDNQTLQAELIHDLADDWSLRLAGHYKSGRMHGFATEASVLEADGYTLLRDRRYRDYEWENGIAQLELRGRLMAAGLEHELLAGLEYERYQLDETLLRTGPASPIDIRRPLYGQLPASFNPARRTDREQTSYSRSLMLQDQITVTEHWRVLAGVRYDQYDRQLVNQVNSTRQPQRLEEVTPRLGVLYQLTDQTGLFANASRSFKPNGGLDAAGNPFEPEQGLGYEAGVKFESGDGRFGMTLAAFSIEKENVLTSDPDDNTYQIAAGEVRSRGFDVQLSGQLSPSVRVIGGYAYVDAEVRRDNTLRPGARLLNVPRHNAGLLGVYQWQRGALAELEVGAALTHVDERSGDVTDSGFELPSYTRVDLLARYPLGDRIELQVNLDNLFDRTYYERSYSNLWVSPGAPRNLTVALDWQW